VHETFYVILVRVIEPDPMSDTFFLPSVMTTTTIRKKSRLTHLKDVVDELNDNPHLVTYAR